MSSDSSSGGGIVRGGASSASEVDDMRAFRRRWTIGVAIVTIAVDGGFRGVTVSGLMPLALEPPSIAIALQADSMFQHWLVPGRRIGISILDRQMEFLSERFAGRAPVPDGAFTGITHRVVDEVPLLVGALAWCVAEVSRVQAEGDHILVTAIATSFEIPADSDEPMVLYQGRYRGLEGT